MYTNEQASNLSPTILTVLDGPYRRLSVFVRGCWGLFSCIVHTVMDFAMKYIFLVSNHELISAMTFWMTCQFDKMRDFKF